MSRKNDALELFEDTGTGQNVYDDDHQQSDDDHRRRGDSGPSNGGAAQRTNGLTMPPIMEGFPYWAKKLFQKANDPDSEYCEPCRLLVYRGQLQSHAESSKHQRRAFMMSRPVPAGFEVCNVCGDEVRVGEPFRTTHRKTQSHLNSAVLTLIAGGTISEEDTRNVMAAPGPPLHQAPEPASAPVADHWFENFCRGHRPAVLLTDIPAESRFLVDCICFPKGWNWCRTCRFLFRGREFQDHLDSTEHKMKLHPPTDEALAQCQVCKLHYRITDTTAHRRCQTHLRAILYCIVAGAPLDPLDEKAFRERYGSIPPKVNAPCTTAQKAQLPPAQFLPRGGPVADLPRGGPDSRGERGGYNVDTGRGFGGGQQRPFGSRTEQSPPLNAAPVLTAPNNRFRSPSGSRGRSRSSKDRDRKRKRSRSASSASSDRSETSKRPGPTAAQGPSAASLAPTTHIEQRKAPGAPSGPRRRAVQFDDDIAMYDEDVVPLLHSDPRGNYGMTRGCKALVGIPTVVIEEEPAIMEFLASGAAMDTRVFRCKFQDLAPVELMAIVRRAPFLSQIEIPSCHCISGEDVVAIAKKARYVEVLDLRKIGSFKFSAFNELIRLLPRLKFVDLRETNVTEVPAGQSLATARFPSHPGLLVDC